MFNEAKKKTFLTEARTVYKEATKKYINESMKGNNIRIISSKNENNLNLTGEKMDYCINLDSRGKITALIVSNDTYYIEYTGSDIEDLKLEDVKEGKINVDTCKAMTPVKNCSSGLETLTQGDTFETEQYKYKYKGDASFSLSEDGWGVWLKDKNSTSPVTETVCTFVDGKPVVSMIYMFKNSKASSFDLSTWNTSNIKYMAGMFANTTASVIDVSNLDTSNVTMMGMDYSRTDYSTGSGSGMFDSAQATQIIGLENFDTSNVTNMSCMFHNSKLTTIDVSKFDTHNVKQMKGMFAEGNLTSITGLEKFDTSNVTNMLGMFDNSKVKILDLSGFDTSNVVTMAWMFHQSQVETIYVGDKWSTSKISGNYVSGFDSYANDYKLFWDNYYLKGQNGTTFNSSNWNKTYARVDKSGYPGYFTLKTN